MKHSPRELGCCTKGASTTTMQTRPAAPQWLQGLHDEMATVDEDLLEADAKNRLYQLLGERTRQEHMALDQKVR